MTQARYNQKMTITNIGLGTPVCVYQVISGWLESPPLPPYGRSDKTWMQEHTPSNRWDAHKGQTLKIRISPCSSCMLLDLEVYNFLQPEKQYLLMKNVYKDIIRYYFIHPFPRNWKCLLTIHDVRHVSFVFGYKMNRK